jgi:Tfp pilus assembly protein PilF
MLGGGSRLALAGALLDAGQVDAAAKEIAEAVRLNGPSAWSHVALARVAELRGDGGERGRQAALAREALRGADVAEVPRL